MPRFSLLMFLIVSNLFLNAVAQPKPDSLLVNILRTNAHPVVDLVMNDPTKFRCQIIYTQINRDKQNVPTFKNYYFNYDSLFYFNPASTVKMPLAFLALEKLNSMGIKGVNKYTPIQFDSSHPGQKIMHNEASSENGLPSIAHFIKRALLISENDPYNRLYQFLGQEAVNRNLHSKGYRDVRITRQFMGFTAEQNRHTNQVRFIKKDGTPLHIQPAAYNTDSFDFSNVVKLGKGYLNRNDSLVNEPFDFTQHNNVSLLDLQQMLQSVMFPSSVPKQQRFNLTKDDYKFLYRYLSQYPSETNYPKYDTSKFYDSYVKFFFRDSTQKIPLHVRIFNKVGWAYGFCTDISYVVDFKNKVEFMLAATVYVNSDEILNDNKYEYTTVGYPFLYQVGQSIYEYELQRKRSYKPDLSAFGIQYEKRNPNDKRPDIKEVDN